MTLPDIGAFANQLASPGYSRANQRADDAIWDAAEARFKRLALVQQRARDLAQSLAMCERFGDDVPGAEAEHLAHEAENAVAAISKLTVNDLFDQIARGDAA